MAKKPLTAAELEKKHGELSNAADDALNAHLPQVPAVERRVALLIGRTPGFFSNARPKTERGRWVIALHRKIFLLKEIEAKAEEVAKLRNTVK
jgi:hypothetical protein